MQELRLWFFVADDVRRRMRQESRELSVITKAIATSIVLQHTQHRIATTMQDTTESAVTVAMIQYSIVQRNWELADRTQPSLFGPHLNSDGSELSILELHAIASSRATSASEALIRATIVNAPSCKSL